MGHYITAVIKQQIINYTLSDESIVNNFSGLEQNSKSHRANNNINAGRPIRYQIR